MKLMTFLTFFLLAQLNLGANRFDQMQAYAEVQRLMKVQGEKRAALELAQELISQLDSSDELYIEVNRLINYLEDGNPHYVLDKAIKFATGSKEEIYCKDIGLVYLKAMHNDGTISTVKLIKSARVLFGNHYSQIKSGDWSYEFDSAYREAINSESWLDESSKNSYKIREFRRRHNDLYDEGKWTRSWYNAKSIGTYVTRGEVLEPVPLFMANDYHLWGTYDLGFKVRFKVGAKDQVHGRASGASQSIILKTAREVVAKLPQFDYADVKGNAYSYSDCYKVKSIVELDRLEERQQQKTKKTMKIKKTLKTKK